MSLRVPLRGSVVLAGLLALATAACPTTPVEQQPCNRNSDCPGSQVCREGLCAVADDAGASGADRPGDAAAADHAAGERPAGDRLADELGSTDQGTEDRTSPADTGPGLDQIVATDHPGGSDLGGSDGAVTGDATSGLDRAGGLDSSAGLDLSPGVDSAMSIDVGAGDGNPTGDSATGSDAAGPTDSAGAADASAPSWWDPRWPLRCMLSFNNGQQSSELIDFPVLVRLTAQRFDFSQGASNGADLRFVAADQQTVLAHEIESYQAQGDAWIWVKVPRIGANSVDDHIWLYYGVPGAVDAQQPAAVWSADYVAVWHLHGGADDSTGLANHGTAAGPVAATGKVAGGRQFDGVNDLIDVAVASSLTDLFASGATLSAWIYPRSPGEGGFGRFFDQATDLNGRSGFNWSMHAVGNLGMRFDRGYSQNKGGWNTGNSLVLNQWQYVAVSYVDGLNNRPSFYRDGAAIGLATDNAPVGSPMVDSSLGVRVGNFLQEQSRTFDGTLDELRIARTVRSAAWIAAQHLSMTDQFVRYSCE